VQGLLETKRKYDRIVKDGFRDDSAMRAAVNEVRSVAACAVVLSRQREREDTCTVADLPRRRRSSS
jgi:hypothetical protein